MLNELVRRGAWVKKQPVQTTLFLSVKDAVLPNPVWQGELQQFRPTFIIRNFRFVILKCHAYFSYVNQHFAFNRLQSFYLGTTRDNWRIFPEFYHVLNLIQQKWIAEIGVLGSCSPLFCYINYMACNCHFTMVNTYRYIM